MIALTPRYAAATDLLHEDGMTAIGTAVYARARPISVSRASAKQPFNASVYRATKLSIANDPDDPDLSWLNQLLCAQR